MKRGLGQLASLFLFRSTQQAPSWSYCREQNPRVHPLMLSFSFLLGRAATVAGHGEAQADGIADADADPRDALRLDLIIRIEVLPLWDGFPALGLEPVPQPLLHSLDKMRRARASPKNKNEF
jgi:hypothetical protein